MNNRKKRMLALLLAFALVFGMVTPGFAAGGWESGTLPLPYTSSDFPQIEMQTTSPAALGGLIEPFNIPLPADFNIFLDNDGVFRRGAGGGQDVTSDINAMGATFDTATQTLTLNNFEFRTIAAEVIRVPIGTTIELIGTNSLVSEHATPGNGIFVPINGSITISGDGILNVHSIEIPGTGSIGITGGVINVTHSIIPVPSIADNATVTLTNAPPRTITLNATTGTVDPASGTTGANGRLTNLPTPTRTGYSFDGWFTTATGGTQITAGTTGTIFFANATIYAQWTLSHITLTPATATINDTNLTATSTAGGTATGTITFDRGTLPTAVQLSYSGNTITVTGTRPAAGQPAITGTYTVDVTRSGVTQQLTITVNLTPIAHTLTLTPATATINDTNLIATTTAEGTAIGMITFNRGTLPAAVQLSSSGDTITVTGTRPAAGQPAITGTYTVDVIRSGVTQPLSITVNLTPIAHTLTLTLATATINDTNLIATTTAGGTATGAISFNRGALPTAVQLSSSGDTITVTGTRPAAGQPAITGTYTVDVTRSGITQPLTITVNLTPIAHTLTLTPAIATINDTNLTATTTAGGTATGMITFNRGTLPAAVQLSSSGDTITVTGTRPAAGQPAITGTYTVDVIRSGVTQPLSITVNLTPIAHTLTLTSAIATINDANLTETTTAGGTAIGAITFDRGTLPTAVQLSYSGNTITVTGTRPAAGQPAVTGTYTIDVTRSGITQPLTITINLTPLPPDVFAITWYTDGGAPAPTQTTVTLGGEITAPATMTRAGHTFGGWYMDSAFTTPAVFPITNVTTNTTLWANWTVAVCAHPTTSTAITPATCTTAGSTVVTCDDCNEVVSTTPIPELGHDLPTIWTVITPATCGVDGVEYRQCTRPGCTHEETQPIPALAHNWSAWTETAAPTCELEGEETRTCTNCQTTETRPLAALGHTWGEWLITTQPTATTAGTQTRTCSTCNITETRSIPATGTGNQDNNQQGGDSGSDRDPSPTSAWLNNNRVTFDIANPQDITITLNSGDFSFRNIRFGNVTLVRDVDFTVNSNRYTISAEFLSTLEVGQRRLTFDMSGGTNPTLVITVSDSTETVTPTPEPTPAPIQEPAPDIPTAIEIHIREEELIALLEQQQGVIIEEGGITIIIPDELLRSLIDIDNPQDVTLRLNVTPGDMENGTLLAVDVSIIVGDSVVAQTAVPFTVAVSLEDVNLEGFNTYRLVALNENGEILGGRYDRQTGLFIFEAQGSGTFAITYIETLNRLTLQLDSPVILDLAGNAPTQHMDVLPTIQNNRTLIPIRFVAEALGAEVDWTPASENRPLTVFLTLDGQPLSFAIGEVTPELAALGMDVPAQLMGGRTMIPLRFVSEFFGAIVTWDAETRSIEIIRDSSLS